MLIDEYDAGQHRMCVSIRSCTNVTVENLTLARSGGDGIYLGVWPNIPWPVPGVGHGPPNDTIDIMNCVFDENARNGLSIISARNVTISGCTFSNTGQENFAAGKTTLFCDHVTPANSTGLAPCGPWAGIDIEPNRPDEILDDINIINNCTFTNNRRSGIQFGFGHITTAVDITITDCVIENSERGFIMSGNGVGAGGKITIERCNISDMSEYGFFFRNWERTAGINDVFINECELNNTTQNGNNGAIHFEYNQNDLISGGVTLNQIRVINNISDYAVKFEGYKTGSEFRDIEINAYTDDLNKTVCYNPDHANVDVKINEAPQAPSNLIAVASTYSIDLNWIDNSSNEDGFKIERKTGLSGNWEQIRSVGNNTTSITDEFLEQDGKTYYYRVISYILAANSEYSNSASATLPWLATIRGPHFLEWKEVGIWTASPLGGSYEWRDREDGSSSWSYVKSTNQTYQSTMLDKDFELQLKVMYNGSTQYDTYNIYYSEQGIENETPFRVEAENMVLNGPITEEKTTASNGYRIMVPFAVGVGTASYTFDETEGSYELHVYYGDEDDGQSTSTVKINDVSVHSWQWNLDNGWNDHEVGTFSFAIGDVILLDLDIDSGEP